MSFLIQVQDADTKEKKTLPVGEVMATESSDFTAGEKSKLAGIEAEANNYAHPTTDGNKHLPANGTTNAGKVPTASAVAGVYTLETPATTDITGKVDKITGKGLSENDFTTVLKNKVDGIEAGAQVNVAPTTLDLGAKLTVNGTFKGITMTGTVDTNAVGVGALLAIGTDGNFDEADADDIAKCYMLALATATGTGAKTLLLQGLICNTAWNFNIGLPIYASITQGTLSQSIVSGTDDVNIMIGFALSATCIYFNPYMAYVTKT